MVGCTDRESAESRVDSEPASVPARPPGEAAGFGPVGIQLYTLRDLMAVDVAATLEQVATIGYREVEFAGYFDTPAREVRRLLDSLGLVAPSAHIDLATLDGPDADKAIDDAAEIGHRYLIVPWLDEAERGSLERYREHAARFNRLGERCRANGIAFGYHNHAFEFESLDGGVPYDILLAESDADLVKFELDLFWVRAGGGDALHYLRGHPGRFELSHVKDMSLDGTMVDVGDGAVDFAGLISAGVEAGMRHFFVEHDTPADPLATAARSYAHLVNLELS